MIIMQNTLFTNDNLFVLYGMNSEIADLIYLDPPFNSKRMYSAPVGTKAAGASFKDMWTWEDVNDAYLDKLIDKYPSVATYIRSIGKLHSKAMMAYVTYMTQRLIEMHRILKPTGSLYLHCDPTASHYLKNLLDGIFGRKNFRNEIVWCYGSGGASTKHFSKKHDVILFYSKTDNYVFEVDSVREEYSSPEKVEFKVVNGKSYLRKHPKGRIPFDWWRIPILTNTAKERTGYPTQKPLALLHRIIKASTKEGDLVLDPFCGCATTCVAAQQLQRKWIGIDIEKQAASVLLERLSDDAGFFKDFVKKSFLLNLLNADYLMNKKVIVMVAEFIYQSINLKLTILCQNLKAGVIIMKIINYYVEAATVLKVTAPWNILILKSKLVKQNWH
jgi:DNA modification methylase